MKLRVLFYCLLGGLPLLIPAMGTGHPVQWLSSGIVLAAGFVPVALFGPRRFLAQFGVIVPVLLIVGSFCTLSEAYFFTPNFRQHAITDFFGASVLYLIVAVVLAFLASVLKLNRQSEHAVSAQVRCRNNRNVVALRRFLRALLLYFWRDHLPILH